MSHYIFEGGEVAEISAADADQAVRAGLIYECSDEDAIELRLEENDLNGHVYHVHPDHEDMGLEGVISWLLNN